MESLSWSSQEMENNQNQHWEQFEGAVKSGWRWCDTEYCERAVLLLSKSEGSKCHLSGEQSDRNREPEWAWGMQEAVLCS